MRLSSIDLFAGAGGLSYGFMAEGFDPVLACDYDHAAVDTYRANLGDHVEQLDLSMPIKLPRADVVVGGPPCQGFSSAGARRDGDHRNTLVRRFAEVVAASGCQAFVFENVEGFLTFEGGDYVIDLLEPVIEAGYRVHLRKINAANYGVPQHRKRVLAIGGLGWDPTFPEATHWAFGAPGAHRAARGLARTPTLEDVLVNLPAASTSPPGDPTDHVYRPLSGIDLERARALLPGQTMRDLPTELWHPSYRRRAFRRVADGTPTERRGGAPAGLRRLRADEPSKAITGGAKSEFLHPVEHRTLTLRECARIQTFPDDFAFMGTASQKAVLIGNAVPPLLAAAVARSLARDLTAANPGLGGGALLSFVPTLANGMSPALAHVVQRVSDRFELTARLETLPLWA
jgi:DNA (cytosine-5)-methyltransferase 1